MTAEEASGMRAMVVVPAGALREEWLEARRKMITASEISIVMGLSPYSSPYALFHRKTGVLPAEPDNDAMALGRHMESYVAEQFARRHPEFLVLGDGTALFAHPGRPWMGATPDRLVHERWGFGRDPLAVLECKVDGGSEDWGEDGSDQIPVHYRCQVLFQMDVLGVTTGYLACLLWHRRQVRVYELTMDRDAWHDLVVMRGEAEMFLRRIEAGDPPDVDWRPATRDALKRLHPSLEDRDVYVTRQRAKWYRAACRNLKAAERNKQLHENRMRALLGSGRRVIDSTTGEPVARRDVYDLPEKQITRKASTVDRLVAVFPKEKS